MALRQEVEQPKVVKKTFRKTSTRGRPSAMGAYVEYSWNDSLAPSSSSGKVSASAVNSVILEVYSEISFEKDDAAEQVAA